MANDNPTCPVCEGVKLEPAKLAEGLKSLACPSCGGGWINGVEYFDWLSARVSKTASADDPALTLTRTATDSDAGKLCLDCGRFMRRVAVGHGQGFHLDRCTSCGGFWFDAREWESLQASGLHNQAHQVFTDSWQAEVRRQASELAEQRRLNERLGEQGVQQLEQIKQWLTEHPRGNEILAALTAVNGS